MEYMKNVMIYINPAKKFDTETELLAKIQIDNSLRLGWKKEDILMVTNFPYEHNGIKAWIVADDIYCPFYKYVSKINAIIRLHDQGIITGRELYWFHDFDAYENNKIDEKELGLESVNAGFTDYGRMPRWNGGSFFFKVSAMDIFEKIQKMIYENYKIRNLTGGDRYHLYSEEIALESLSLTNWKNINDKIIRMNYTYNFGMRNIKSNYRKTDKPIRVLHFHPYKKEMDTLAIAMYGKNRLGVPLMTEPLIQLFNTYGIH